MEQLERLEEEHAVVSAYRVVIPSNCGAELVSKANELAKAILRHTKVDAYVLSDSEYVINQDETIREVLVGQTNRVLSEQYLSDLNRDDYLCCAREGCLILGGVSESACVMAIDAFCNRYLPFAEQNVLMKEADSIRYEAEYEWKGAQINGVSLKQYCLVYPFQNLHREREIADSLRNTIADRCGVYLEVVSDAEYAREARMIEVGACFGLTLHPEDAYLAENENGIALYASNSYGLSELAKVLCGQLFDELTKGQTASWTLQGSQQVFCECPAVSVLNLASEWEMGRTPMADFVEFARWIAEMDADLMLLGSMEEELWKMVKAALPSRIVFECVSLSNGTVLPVLFRNTEEPWMKVTPLSLSENVDLLEISLLKENKAFKLIYILEEAPLDVQAIRGALHGDSDAAWILNGVDGCRSLVSAAGEMGKTAVGRSSLFQESERMLAVLADRNLSAEEGEHGIFSLDHVIASYQSVLLLPAFAS